MADDKEGGTREGGRTHPAGAGTRAPPTPAHAAEDTQGSSVQVVMAQEPPVFGAVLVGSSFGITNESFSRVDAGHWTLDVSTSIRPDYENIKEICVFLLPQARDQLPADCALGIYVSACGSEFEYRGAVSIGCPSVTLPLAWPQKESQQAIGNATASIGISIEPLASLAGKEDSKLGDKEEFAKRVAMDLYRYMESFQSTIHSSTEYLMVPQKVIEMWFEKFKTKFRKDKDYLTRPSSMM